MASHKDGHLYSVPHGKKGMQTERELTTGASLAFSTQLSSLISAGKAQGDRPAAGRSRGAKEDLFTQNRNTHKRAKRDLESHGAIAKTHTTATEGLDASAWHRSRRNMEEKARIYAAMKRGDIDDEQGKHMVDFDRKWAETESKDADHRWDDESPDESEQEDQEQVEWTDEFGRSRTGTRAQMLRAQRGQRIAEELDERARPAAPTNIIYGDSVQSAAFNPDRDIAERMADIAAKRDRSLTPPPDMHFDSSKEVRHKGVGFMQFSLDADERTRQMEELQQDRQETERKRGERERKLRERKEMLSKRRQEIDAKRSKRKADEFLEELGKEMVALEAKKDEDTKE